MLNGISLIGPNLFSTNYASYVRHDYIFNAEFRTNESAISLMEKLNAMSEQQSYFYWYLYNRQLEAENDEDELDLFESHLDLAAAQ